MKTIRASFGVFIFLLCTEFLSAQNLVKNPSFEYFIKCPQTFNLFNGYVEDWYGLNSSFYHSCSSPPQVPKNSMGYQVPKTGNGYAHIKTFAYYFNPDGRTYVEAEFNSLLLKDQYYCVSYYVSLTENSTGAIKDVDAYFSDTLVKWNYNNHRKVLNELTPQIKSVQMLNDSINWIRVNGLYKAKGGEKHLLIGNFLPDNRTTVFSFMSGEAIQVHYLIDDVSVEPLNITVPSLGKDTTICRSSNPYSLAAPSGYDAYEWSNGDTTSSIEVKTGGEYWVKCFLDSCGFVADTVSISLYNSPELQLGRDTTICKGSKLQISATAGFDSYLWNTAESSAGIEVSKAGSYIVTAIDKCGMQSDTIVVDVDSIPDIQVHLGTDTSLCQNGKNHSITLSANIPLPNYSWSNGSSSGKITIHQKGKYWLESNFPCGTLKSNTISIEECPPDTIELYVPNSFTPDGDGLNDRFSAVPHNVRVLELKIFNRWGELMHDAEEPYSWDGTCHGSPCQVGIYVYLFH